MLLVLFYTCSSYSTYKYNIYNIQVVAIYNYNVFGLVQNVYAGGRVNEENPDFRAVLRVNTDYSTFGL